MESLFNIRFTCSSIRKRTIKIHENSVYNYILCIVIMYLEFPKINFIPLVKSTIEMNYILQGKTKPKIYLTS